MINLKRLFENFFDDKEISRQELRKFCEDHLQRLAVQNNTNLYTTILNETVTAYNSYFGAITDHDTATALKESRSQSMNLVFASFKKKVSEIADFIAYKLKKDSPAYQEFFPQGLTEYSNATLENVETLMERMITALDNHSAVLGTDPLNEFNEIRDNFLAARGQQLTQKGKVSDASGSAEERGLTLEMQLTKNVHVIALNNLGKAEVVNQFFDQSILKLSKGGDDEETPPVNP